MVRVSLNSHKYLSFRTHAFPSTLSDAFGSIRRNATQDASQHLSQILRERDERRFVVTQGGSLSRNDLRGVDALSVGGDCAPLAAFSPWMSGEGLSPL